VGSVFVDTSALVKYYYPEMGSEKVELQIVNADKVYLCQLTPTEFASALMKKVRDKTLDLDRQEAIWNAFLDDLSSLQIELVPLTQRHFEKTTQMIRSYGHKEGIRTLDSLQLVTALEAEKAKFLSADKSLAALAVKIGLSVEKI